MLLKKTVRKHPTVRLPLGNITNYKTHHVRKRRTVGTKVLRDNEVDQSVDPNSASSLLMEKQQEEQIDIYQLEPQDKQFSVDEAHHVALPSSSWHVRKPTADSCNFFEVVTKDVTTVIEKDVNIDFKNQKVSVTFHSKKVPSFEGSCTPSTSKDMEELLLSIHKSKICPGIMHNPIKHPHQSTVVRNGNQISNVWRANRYVNKYSPSLIQSLFASLINAILIYFFSCRILIASNEETMKPCSSCKLLDFSLRKRLKRQKTVKDHTKLNHCYMSLKQLAKKVSQKGKNELQLKKKTREKEHSNQSMCDIPNNSFFYRF